MSLIHFALASCIMWIFLFWIVTGKQTYRRPLLLLIYSMVAGGVTIILKMSPILWKSIMKAVSPTEQIFTEMHIDAANAIIDVMMVGLCTGLMAAAFMLKAQQAHGRDVINLKSTLDSARKKLALAEKMDQKLMEEAKDLTDGEFRKRYDALSYDLTRSRADLRQALRDFDRVNDIAPIG